VNEQGRAAISAWRQTVDAAWNQQAATLAASTQTGGITIEVLRAVMPNLPADKAAEYLPMLNAAMAEARIDTPLRQAAFLAQIAHESGELKYFEELASGKAYENRKDLGNVKPGDGPRYKGRGPIQITGRANYRKYGKLLGVDLENNPDLAATPEVGFRIACHYWRYRSAWGDLNDYADQGDFDHTVLGVNGGWYGYDDRVWYYNQALGALPENLSIGGDLTS
jgi:putative chitinase